MRPQVSSAVLERICATGWIEKHETGAKLLQNMVNSQQIKNVPVDTVRTKSCFRYKHPVHGARGS